MKTVDELMKLMHINGAVFYEIGFHRALKNMKEVRRLEISLVPIAEKLAELRAALAGVGQWLPIADVPSDHFPRLYLSRQKVFHGFVDVTGQLMFYTELGYRKARRKPTHWQPLPIEPTTKGE